MHGNYVYGNETLVRVYKAMTPEVPANLDDLIGHLPAILEQYAWVVDLPGEWSANLDIYLLELGRLGSVPLDDLDEAELWDHVLEVNDLGAWYFKPNIAVSLSHHLLTTVMKRLCLVASRGQQEESEKLFSELLSVTETRTGQINRRLYDPSPRQSAEAAVQFVQPGRTARHSGG